MFSSMKRVTRAARSFTLAECSKSMSSLLVVHLLRHVPRDTRHQACPATLLEGVRAGRVALQRTRMHAMQDRGDAEHIEDQVELPVRDALAAGAPAIRCDVRGFGRNAERREIATLEAAELSRREAPRHHLIGEVRQRMTQRRELPV